MIDLTHLFDFIDLLSVVEYHIQASNGERPSLQYLHSLLRNVHPSTALTSIIEHMKTFETVEFELGMLGVKPRPLYLQCKPIGLGIARPEYLSVRQGADKQEPVFVHSLNALQHVLQGQLFNLCDVALLLQNVEILFVNRQYRILALLGALFRNLFRDSVVLLGWRLPAALPLCGYVLICILLGG